MDDPGFGPVVFGCSELTVGRQCCSPRCWRHRGVCLCEIHGAGTAYREQEDTVGCQICMQLWALEHGDGELYTIPGCDLDHGWDSLSRQAVRSRGDME